MSGKKRSDNSFDINGEIFLTPKPDREKEIDTIGENSPSIFELWLEYQAIARHFNDLILKVRIQALGAVLAIISLVGFLGKFVDNMKESAYWGVFTFVFCFLMVSWVAIRKLDLEHYNLLLRGAVLAIRKLEAQSLDECNLSRPIEFSTIIDDVLKSTDQRVVAKIKSRTSSDVTEEFEGEKVIIVSKSSNVGEIFYAMILVSLFVGFLVSLAKFVATQ